MSPFIVTTKRKVTPPKCDYDTESGKPCQRDATWEFPSEEEFYCSQHARMVELEFGTPVEWGVSRVAVDTLDEAKQIAREGIEGLASAHWFRLYGHIERISESGGTVTLPDGTVIEVKLTTWTRLGAEARAATRQRSPVVRAEQGHAWAQQRTLDAWNRAFNAQEATGRRAR